MQTQLRDLYYESMANGYVAHLLTIAGFVLALFLVARLMSEKKAPANTFAWLLVILLIPYVGVPLYLLFGNRKLRKIAARKSLLLPALPRSLTGPAARAGGPVAHTITAAGGTPPVGGNRLQLLPSGEEEFAAFERHALAAQHSIHVTTFILGRDDTGRRVVELLAARARAGVKVRLLLDSLGCLGIRASFLAPLRRAGGEIARFMPVLPLTARSSANLRNHRKLAIFDHTRALIGGRNLAMDYMGIGPYKQRFRDLGVQIDGPAAGLLNEIFIADWCFAKHCTADSLHDEVPSRIVDSLGASDLQVVASGPDVPGDPLYEGIIAMIQEAEKSICIVTPYFIPDDVLLRSLIVKARAGRDVTLIVPAHSNHPVTDFARRHYTRELWRAGGKVMLFKEGMLHSKAMLIDDRIGLVGSANFDLRSLFVNFELGVFIHHRADVEQLAAWKTELLQHCFALPERSAKRRVLGGVAEDLSRLLAPLL